MHRSRLAGFIIDCRTDDLDGAATFWGQALGLEPNRDSGDPEDTGYIPFHRKDPNDINIEVQRVAHDSRVHLDIETDDVEAEVERLLGIGATVVKRVHTWCVMEAPTGHRFCVVRASSSKFAHEATVWP
jgi:predicted enzyme related to lactoylglutathione lyase